MAAWELALRGRRVMVVDADPQCNLTNCFIPAFEDRLEAMMDGAEQNLARNNIWAMLEPVRQGDLLHGFQAIGCIDVSSPAMQDVGGALLVLAGSPSLINLDLALPNDLRMAAITIDQLHANVPGAIIYGIRATAWWHDIDTVLVDMSPSGGFMNMLLVFSSTSLIIPATPSSFMIQVLRRGAQDLFIQWFAQYDDGHRGINRDSPARKASFKLPWIDITVLGVIVNQCRPHDGGFSAAVRHMVTRLGSAIQNYFVPHVQLRNIRAGPNLWTDDPSCAIPNLDALGPLSQYLNTAPQAIPNHEMKYFDADRGENGTWVLYGKGRLPDMLHKRDVLQERIKIAVDRMFYPAQVAHEL